MKIKLLTSLATSAMAYAQGQEVDWEDADAQRLISAGVAVAVAHADLSPKKEAMTVSKGEAFCGTKKKKEK